MNQMRAVLWTTIFGLLLAVPAAAGGPGGLVGSSGWKAEVDRSQPSPAKLVITARLQVRTPGYKAVLKRTRVFASNPPVPVYELHLTPPTKPVIQVLTWMDFRHVEPVTGPVYRTVIVRYRDRILARLKVANAGK